MGLGAVGTLIQSVQVEIMLCRKSQLIKQQIPVRETHLFYCTSGPAATSSLPTSVFLFFLNCTSEKLHFFA
jgi:hypothetical protein